MDKSYKEVFTVSFPLVLGTLSGSIMMFFNRMFLLNYSFETFNAVALVIPVYSILMFGGSAIIGISEVFIGELNGQKNFSKTAQIAWQMVWLSLATIPLFVGARNLLADLLIPSSLYEHGFDYFNWIILCVPLSYLVVALSSFFVAIKKTKVIVATTVAGNLANILLDWLFIYGYGIIPKLGGFGAALATMIALLIQLGFLLHVFLKDKYQQRYETRKLTFSLEIIKDCWKLGYPNAIGQIVELSGIYTAFYILSNLEPVYITVFSMGQAFIGLFAFITDGMKRGVIAICSNLIGEKSLQSGFVNIGKCLKAHILIFTTLILLLNISLVIFFQPFIDFVGLKSSVNDPMIVAEMFSSIQWICCFLLIDGVSWIISGALIALKDTKFIMAISCAAMWTIFLMPLYILTQNHLPPRFIWVFACLYSIAIVVAFMFKYARFRLIQQLPL